jgi:hypothetical protein
LKKGKTNEKTKAYGKKTTLHDKNRIKQSNLEKYWDKRNKVAKEAKLNTVPTNTDVVVNEKEKHENIKRGQKKITKEDVARSKAKVLQKGFQQAIINLAETQKMIADGSLPMETEDAMYQTGKNESKDEVEEIMENQGEVEINASREIEYGSNDKYEELIPKKGKENKLNKKVMRYLRIIQILQ